MQKKLFLSFVLSAMVGVAAAQTPAPTGKIHGHVNGPEGAPMADGSVSLSTDGGHSNKFTFPVSAAGDYLGEAAVGTYTVIYRKPDTPANQMVDAIENIKLLVGQDLAVNIDMSRKEYMDKLTPEQRKQVEEIRKHNESALKANDTAKIVMADMKQNDQDMAEIAGARAAALAQLGASATKAEIEAKEAELKAAKYTDIESLMQKDTALLPNESALWVRLGQAELGLKKYDEATAAYTKAVEVDKTAKKPNLQAQGAAHSGLGEVLARQNKAAEADAEYEAAAKANPSLAATYRKNEAVVFYQEHNADAQAAAADKAIQVDPELAVAYYLKGNGLVGRTTADPKTQKLIAPAGCLEAYAKYLELAPSGPYANEVKEILAGFGQKIETTYKARPAKK